jgi:hypothetical protein
MAMKTMIILKQFHDDYHHIIVFMFADRMNMHFYIYSANLPIQACKLSGHTKQLIFPIAKNRSFAFSLAFGPGGGGDGGSV